jgi:hypothetical protein
MESENKVANFSKEIVCYVVAELHVHAILSGAVIATAHHIEENKVGIVVSGVLIVGMFITKRRYPHKIFHLVRLDRLYHKATGKLVRIDEVDYHEKNGFLIRVDY